MVDAEVLLEEVPGSTGLNEPKGKNHVCQGKERECEGRATALRQGWAGWVKEISKPAGLE
jgi:hypothetical protein